MAWEAVGALLVGLAALAFVLAPLLGPAHGPADGTDEFEDPEETPRGQALAALREIEFDRATGKLSDEDYADLKARYTTRALAALRTDDAVTAAGGIEARVAARVKAIRRGEAGEGPACAACGPRPEPDALFCSTCGVVLGGTSTCPQCHAALHPDGRYCGVCGVKVAA